MTRSAKPGHPKRLALALGDQEIVFVRVGDDRYAAEMEGKRHFIRMVQKTSLVSETGVLASYEPTRSEGDTANIDTILRCLKLGATHKALERGVELAATDEWGHFRQNTFLTVTVEIAEDGTIEIHEDIREQDDSYY